MRGGPPAGQPAGADQADGGPEDQLDADRVEPKLKRGSGANPGSTIFPFGPSGGAGVSIPYGAPCPRHIPQTTTNGHHDRGRRPEPVCRMNQFSGSDLLPSPALILTGRRNAFHDGGGCSAESGMLWHRYGNA